MTSRPKLLFLARQFPPLHTIASVRTWNTAKYLSRQGWDVTVVTPHPSLWRRVENPDNTAAEADREGIRRIFTDHHWRWLNPTDLKCWNGSIGWVAGGICRRVARRFNIDRGTGWIKPGERACSKLTSDDVDLILASGPPFAGFSLARRLSDKLGRPYVLDYRDPWTEGNGRDIRIDKPYAHQREARLLAHCAAVTTVSETKAMMLDRDFGVGDKVTVATNGYDTEELSRVRPFEFGHFAIVYAGRFYIPKRTISPIMAVLKRLKEIETTNEFYFHYYGHEELHVRREAERFGVAEKVVMHGRVPRADALAAERGAGVTVVITSVFDNASLRDKGIVPGKIFELIGLQAPILLISPPGGDAEAILERTGLGRAFPARDAEGTAAFLSELMSGHAVRPKDLNQYSWTNVGKQLNDVLRGVLG